MYPLRQYRLVVFIFLIAVNSLYPAVGVSVDAEAGFRSCVPGRTDDTLFGDFPVLAVNIEPEWLLHPADSIRLKLNLHGDALKYIGGSGELTAGPEVGIEKGFMTHISQASMGVTYNFMPSAFDPTGLERYMEYALMLERTGRGNVSLTGSYTFELQTDIGSSRMDFRNRLQLKASFHVFRYISLNVKAGGLWNLSNMEGAGYLQPILTGGIAGAVDDRTTIITQVYGACSFYKPASVPVLVRAGNSGNGKVKDTLLINQPLDAKPFVTCYIGFMRDLKPELSLHIYYMNTIFGRSRTERLYVSHQVGLCLEWNREFF